MTKDTEVAMLPNGSFLTRENFSARSVMKYTPSLFVLIASLALGACQAQDSARAERIAAHQAAEAREDRKAAEARERTMPLIVGGLLVLTLVIGGIVVIHQRERGINEMAKEAVKSGNIDLATTVIEHAQRSYFPRHRVNDKTIKNITGRNNRTIEGRSRNL